MGERPEGSDWWKMPLALFGIAALVLIATITVEYERRRPVVMPPPPPPGSGDWLIPEHVERLAYPTPQGGRLDASVLIAHAAAAVKLGPAQCTEALEASTFGLESLNRALAHANRRLFSLKELFKQQSEAARILRDPCMRAHLAECDYPEYVP